MGGGKIMNIQDYKGVFVFAQQVDNELSGIALELVGKGKDLAKDLGTEVTAVLVGSGVAALADAFYHLKKSSKPEIDLLLIILDILIILDNLTTYRQERCA